MTFLKRYSDHLYSLMRVIPGFLFACHGAQKLFGVLGGPEMRHIPLMLAAGIIEFFGGLLIALGVFTAIAAFIASGEMATAYFLRYGFKPACCDFFGSAILLQTNDFRVPSEHRF